VYRPAAQEARACRTADPHDPWPRLHDRACMTTTNPDRSLRGRLIGNLLVAALSMAVLLGIAGALIIYRVANLLYDRQLDGALQAMADRLVIEAAQVTIDLPPVALGMLENEDRDNIYYSVR